MKKTMWMSLLMGSSVAAVAQGAPMPNANVSGAAVPLTQPVLNTFVPEDIIAKVKSVHGAGLYSITMLKGVDSQAIYGVTVIESGVSKIQWMGADGAVASNVFRTDAPAEVAPNPMGNTNSTSNPTVPVTATPADAATGSGNVTTPEPQVNALNADSSATSPVTADSTILNNGTMNNGTMNNGTLNNGTNNSLNSDSARNNGNLNNGSMNTAPTNLGVDTTGSGLQQRTNTNTQNMGTNAPSGSMNNQNTTSPVNSNTTINGAGNTGTGSAPLINGSNTNGNNSVGNGVNSPREGANPVMTNGAGNNQPNRPMPSGTNTDMKIKTNVPKPPQKGGQ